MKHTKISLLLSACVLATFFGANAQIITTVAGNSTAGYTGNGSPATAAECNNPFGVAVDHSGNIYIADAFNYVIRKVNSAGIISTVAGTNVSGFSGDNGPASNAQISGCNGVAADAAGNVYISDNGNDRIRKISISGIITTIAGSTSTAYSGDGGPATDAGLGSGPWGLGTDAAGNVFFADYSGGIREISTSGIISVVAGNFSGIYGGDGGPATAAGFVAPYGVTIDAAGNMYIADYLDNRVRKVNTAGIVSTIAGNGYLSGSGMGGYSGDGAAATLAELAGPTGVAIDAAGNIYIADMNNHAVRKVNPAGIISTYAGTGMPGFSGDGGPATAATMFAAGGVSLSTSGDLYIADPLNNRIRKVTHAGTTGVANVSDDRRISIYPNPVSTELTITADLITQIIITNLIGQAVYARDYHAETVSVNVADLPVGVYFVRINGTGVRKFVKE
jgi:type IX secretion system substrate protein/NHL repeat-containing protein